MQRITSFLLQLLVGLTFFFLTYAKNEEPTIKQGDVSVTLLYNHTTVNIISPSGRYSVIYAVDYQNPEVALAYLDYNEFGGSGRYKGKFDKLNAPPEVKVTHDTYTKSGYDRGHLISNDFFNFDKVLSQETFSVYNICPQLPSLNENKNGYRAWRDLENNTEKAYANAYGRVYVITGPVFDKEPSQYNVLNNSDCVIPEKFYKIILVQDMKDETYQFTKMEAYLFEHRNPNKGETITLSDCQVISTNDVEENLDLIEAQFNLKIRLLDGVPEEPITSIQPIVDEDTTTVEPVDATTTTTTTTIEPIITITTTKTSITIEPVITTTTTTTTSITTEPEIDTITTTTTTTFITFEPEIVTTTTTTTTSITTVDPVITTITTTTTITTSTEPITTNTPELTTPVEPSGTCKGELLGYKCCSHCTSILEEDGISWGAENGEWCGITDYCIEKLSQSSCKGEKYGYKCCSVSNCATILEENGILWGVENGEWCGITDECIKGYDECWSDKLGYPCCKHCSIITTDESGSWGAMNGNWCGIPTTCAK